MSNEFDAKTCDLIFKQLSTLIKQNAYMTKYAKNALIKRNMYNDVHDEIMKNVVNETLQHNTLYIDIMRTYDVKNEFAKYIE
jgi:O-succinylbenzoate synthase